MPGGLVAAIEVTSTAEQARRRVEAQVRRSGQSSFALPGLTWRWLVRVADDADVRKLSRRCRDELRQLLSDLEAQGARSAHDRGDYRNPVVQQLRDLKIASGLQAEDQARSLRAGGSDVSGRRARLVA